MKECFTIHVVRLIFFKLLRLYCFGTGQRTAWFCSFKFKELHYSFPVVISLSTMSQACFWLLLNLSSWNLHSLPWPLQCLWCLPRLSKSYAITKHFFLACPKCIPYPFRLWNGPASLNPQTHGDGCHPHSTALVALLWQPPEKPVLGHHFSVLLEFSCWPL